MLNTLYSLHLRPFLIATAFLSGVNPGTATADSFSEFTQALEFCRNAIQTKADIREALARIADMDPRGQTIVVHSDPLARHSSVEICHIIGSEGYDQSGTLTEPVSFSTGEHIAAAKHWLTENLELVEIRDRYNQIPELTGHYELCQADGGYISITAGPSYFAGLPHAELAQDALWVKFSAYPSNETALRCN